ncbi:hypothetical protein EVAR_39800_1 [Eumeta japonica]|uniref:Uncharacterized protein n=1 Tax=Eumeta variegata TaxID=151549 RepID=A0A4C1X4L3_EUMVA|nr:hypothetical protein EVAR_39800_1 [Eumeta japonica]
MTAVTPAGRSNGILTDGGLATKMLRQTAARSAASALHLGVLARETCTAVDLPSWSGGLEAARAARARLLRWACGEQPAAAAAPAADPPRKKMPHALRRRWPLCPCLQVSSPRVTSATERDKESSTFSRVWSRLTWVVVELWSFRQEVAKSNEKLALSHPLRIPDLLCKNCVLHEALSILKEDDDVELQKIFIEPPDPTVLSDDDSADEDQRGFINNLTGRQLGARCEVMLAGKSKDRVRRLKAITSKTVKSSSEPQLGPSGNQTFRNRGRGLSQHRSGGRRGGRSHDPDSDSTTGVITNRRSQNQSSRSRGRGYLNAEVGLTLAGDVADVIQRILPIE